MATYGSRHHKPKGAGTPALNIGAELDALAADLGRECGDDDLVTVAEMVEARPERNRKSIRTLLLAAQKLGRLRRGRVLRENLAGFAAPVPGYKILPGKGGNT